MKEKWKFWDKLKMNFSCNWIANLIFMLCSYSHPMNNDVYIFFSFYLTRMRARVQAWLASITRRPRSLYIWQATLHWSYVVIPHRTRRKKQYSSSSGGGGFCDWPICGAQKASRAIEGGCIRCISARRLERERQMKKGEAKMNKVVCTRKDDRPHTETQTQDNQWLLRVYLLQNGYFLACHFGSSIYEVYLV